MKLKKQKKKLSDFDKFLKSEGILEECTKIAKKRVKEYKQKSTKS